MVLYSKCYIITYFKFAIVQYNTRRIQQFAGNLFVFLIVFRNDACETIDEYSLQMQVHTF